MYICVDHERLTRSSWLICMELHCKWRPKHSSSSCVQWQQCGLHCQWQHDFPQFVEFFRTRSSSLSGFLWLQSRLVSKSPSARPPSTPVQVFMSTVRLRGCAPTEAHEAPPTCVHASLRPGLHSADYVPASHLDSPALLVWSDLGLLLDISLDCETNIE